MNKYLNYKKAKIVKSRLGVDLIDSREEFGSNAKAPWQLPKWHPGYHPEKKLTLTGWKDWTGPPKWATGWKWWIGAPIFTATAFIYIWSQRDSIDELLGMGPS